MFEGLKGPSVVLNIFNIFNFNIFNTLGEKFNKSVRFFANCRMIDFYFLCHPEDII
jgi:hypothetical protein